MKIENTTLNFSDMKAEDSYLKGDHMYIMYTCKSESDLQEKFDHLSPGGMVSVKPSKTFFAQSYAAFEDKYGIMWQLIFIDK